MGEKHKQRKPAPMLSLGETRSKCDKNTMHITSYLFIFNYIYLLFIYYLYIHIHLFNDIIALIDKI